MANFGNYKRTFFIFLGLTSIAYATFSALVGMPAESRGIDFIFWPILYLICILMVNAYARLEVAIPGLFARGFLALILVSLVLWVSPSAMFYAVADMTRNLFLFITFLILYWLIGPCIHAMLFGFTFRVSIKRKLWQGSDYSKWILQVLALLTAISALAWFLGVFAGATARIAHVDYVAVVIKDYFKGLIICILLYKMICRFFEDLSGQNNETEYTLPPEQPPGFVDESMSAQEPYSTPEGNRTTPTASYGQDINKS